MSRFWDTYKTYEDERIGTDSNRTHYRKVLSDLETLFSTGFLELTPAQADAYHEYLRNSELADTTKNERLRIVKSVGLYMEEKISGYKSPFTHLTHYTVQSFFKFTEIPTLEGAAAALETAERSGNLRAFLAMTLAFRMCLTTSELIAVTSDHFLTLEDKCYLSVPASQFKERTIQVPEDVVDLIKRLEPGFFGSSGKPLLHTKKGKPIRQVTIAKQVATVSKEAGYPLTLQDIRNLGILLWYQNNPNKERVADYLGSKGNWLFRFEMLAKQPVRDLRTPNITVHLSE